MPLDPHQFWNRSLPQTLLSALAILYIRAVFYLIDLPSNGDTQVGLAKAAKGTAQGILTFAALIALTLVAGFFLAQERKLGYRLALVAAVAPFAINYWIASEFRGLNILEKLCLGELSSFGVLLWLMFTVAVIGLLLHPMSRDYQRVWFK
jgi:hypothetical protein